MSKPFYKFETEREAREWCRDTWPNEECAVIESRHKDNEGGSFFVEANECPFVRSWERLCFLGKGRRALYRFVEQPA